MHCPLKLEPPSYQADPESRVSAVSTNLFVTSAASIQVNSLGILTKSIVKTCHLYLIICLAFTVREARVVKNATVSDPETSRHAYKSLLMSNTIRSDSLITCFRTMTFIPVLRTPSSVHTSILYNAIVLTRTDTYGIAVDSLACTAVVPILLPSYLTDDTSLFAIASPYMSLGLLVFFSWLLIPYGQATSCCCRPIYHNVSEFLRSADHEIALV